MGKLVIIIKKLRKWLLEPKSRDDANDSLSLILIGLIFLSIIVRLLVEVFAIGILPAAYIIARALLGLAAMFALLYVMFCILSFILRIVMNLAVNTYNYFKKGK